MLTPTATRAGPWRIGQVALAAEAETAEDLEPLAARLRGFGPAPADEPGWRVVLRRRPPLRPAPGDGLRQGRLLSGEPYVARLGQKRRFVIDGRLDLAIDPRRRLALCRVGADGARLLAGESGLILIDAVVEQQGQHLLHAALLALPPALGEGGLLLLGDSGAGKSTTALALALGGFPLGGDDAAVLCEADGCPAVWALPRRLKIHRDVAGLLPALAPHLSQERAESVYEAGALAPLVAVLQPIDRPLPLRAICWLGPRSRGGHVCRPLAPIETLSRLAGHDLHAPRALIDASVERQLELFAAAARQVPGFELSLGRDLPALASWLGEILRS